MSHGFEDGNDFTECVVSRRDRSLLVIRVRHHIQSTRKSIGTPISLPSLSCSDPDQSFSTTWRPPLVGEP